MSLIADSRRESFLGTTSFNFIFVGSFGFPTLFFNVTRVRIMRVNYGRTNFVPADDPAGLRSSIFIVVQIFEGRGCFRFLFRHDLAFFEQNGLVFNRYH